MRSESGVGTGKSNKPAGEMYAKWKKKTQREVGGEDEGPRPNAKVNKRVPEELKNAHEIRQANKVKADKKLKNMDKGKRSKVMGLQKKKKSEAGKAKSKGQFNTKAASGNSRKSKVIIRM